MYVDDIIVAHNGNKHLEWFRSKFTGPDGFRAQHVGSLSCFLGIEVVQHANFEVTLSQAQYVSKLLERFVPTSPASVLKHAMPCNPLTFQSLACAKTDLERESLKTTLPSTHRFLTLPFYYDSTGHCLPHVYTMFPNA